MQVLFPCLILLAVENVRLVRNERLDAQELLDSTQFKNAVAKELLKKKLSTLESARQQDSLVTFLRKNGKPLSALRTAPKSSFHKDDDPSRKQAQMANTFIASSNLLFGTKSQQRKACSPGRQTSSKEVLDMRSLRQTYSGYNEEGSDFSASKDAPKPSENTLNRFLSSTVEKRSNPKSSQDPISCYLTEPKKVTCMHKDIIYKIALPSSEVADDEIGRIVESIYRAVEGKGNGKASLEGPVSQKTSLESSAEAADNKKTSDDSSKKKRASEDYLRSLFLNNLLAPNRKGLANYNSNNPVFIPLLIPMAQPKLDPTKTQTGYYTGFSIDPRIQIPMNLSVGVDPVNNYQTGRNLFENGYGQYLVPDGLPELNLKQRSQLNLTAEEEKRRNWLALMATNGLVPVENGVNPKVMLQHSANGEVQSIAEEKDSPGGNKLTVAETGEVLDNFLNKRQQRDTYFLRRQLRRKPITEEKPALSSSHREGSEHVLRRVVQQLSDSGGNILEEKKGCPCPCPCAFDLCASSRSTGKPRKCTPKYPVNRNFQLAGAQPPSRVECCTSTTKCTTTKCPPCSTCPEGCQPIPTTSCKPCSKKENSCGDADILSRAVSGRKKSSGEQASVANSLLPSSHTSHQNWLPYSPQLIPHNRPQLEGQSDESGQLDVAPNDQDNQQPYFASGNSVQYPASTDHKPPQYFERTKDEDQLAQSREQFDHPGMPQQQVSGTFQQQDQPRYPPQNTLVRNHIQVNYKQQPSGLGTINETSAQTGEGSQARGTSLNVNELQNKPLNSPPEHENATSTQNDAKTKKHKDSFFARLRSKFHKGILLNGTEQDGPYSHLNQHVQNKAILGTSIFKFSPRNQTFSSGKNSSTARPVMIQKCPEENHLDDGLVTLTNQTQPSTINNINITISSQTQPGAQIQSHNQTRPQNPPPQKNNPQCPNRVPSTARTSSSGQQSRTNKVSKIWLCPQQPSSINKVLNDTSAQPTTCQDNVSTSTLPSTCGTNQTTTCQTTQSTCQTSRSSPTPLPTCKTSPSTCQNTTTSPSTPLATCGDFWNASTSNGPQTSDFGAAENTPSTCAADTPSSPTGCDIPPGYTPPQPESPWSPGDSRVPPGIPSPPPDTSQDSAGTRMRTYNYGPNPVWNHWQYPMDKVNPRPREQSLNWQHDRVPIPTPYVPQVPQQKQTEQNPKIPPPTQIAYGRPQQANPLPPMAPQQSWYQNNAPPKMRTPLGQARSQQVKLDPKWQSQLSFPLQGPNSVQDRPIGLESRYHQQMRSSANERNDWSGNLPANIKNHIARVRRYLLQKRSSLPKQEMATEPTK